MAAAGGFLVYAGIRDVPLLDGARELVQGRIPTPRTPGGPAGWVNDLGRGAAGAGASGGASSGADAGAASGSAIVDGARRYLGVRYRYGGNDPATGIDCSRLVQLAYGHAGIQGVPRTSGLIRVWPRLRKVAGPAAAGDVLWWMGHVAIATGPTRMIEAPTFGIPVRETAIRRGAVVLRYGGV